MKKYSLVLLLLILPFLLPAQTKSINRFYHTYKRAENVTSFTVPGWIMDLGAAIGKKHVEDETGRSALKLVKKIKKLRLLVMEDYNHVSTQAFNQLVQGVEGDHFEAGFSVRHGDQKVHFFTREKKDKIKNLLILVSSEDQFVLFSAKTKIKYEDLANLINTAMDGDPFDNEPMPEEDADEVKPKKKDQA